MIKKILAFLRTVYIYTVACLALLAFIAFIYIINCGAPDTGRSGQAIEGQ